jgi:hypothetical protein
MRNLPKDVISNIFFFCSPRDVVGDDVLDIFLIRECIQIDKNNLLTSFVIKNRHKSLKLFLHQTPQKYFAPSVIRDLLFRTLRKKDFPAAIILIDGFTDLISQWSFMLIKTCFILITKDKLGENHLVYIFLIKYMMKSAKLEVLNLYHLPMHLLFKLLDHPKSKNVLRYLSKENILTHQYFETLIETVEENMQVDVINKIIVNNHTRLLELFIKSGYHIDFDDVILSIACSNNKMIACILSFFKPRLYTKLLRNLMYKLSSIRDDTNIKKLIKRKLGCECNKRVTVASHEVVLL